MYVHFAVMGLAALGVALGWRYRLSVAVYAVLFTWVELIDRSLYLNHYYWVSLTAALMVVPAAAPDVVARCPRRPHRHRRRRCLPWWCGLLRAQLAMVYLFAGLAKVGDRLAGRTPNRCPPGCRPGEALPMIGPLLTLPATAFLMSWAGALFDLTIVGWLLWRRSPGRGRTRRWSASISSPGCCSRRSGCSPG